MGYRVLIRLGVCSALLLFAAASTFAQTGRILGTVIQRQTGQPLEAAAVVLEGTEIGTLTGSDGRFALAEVPVGSYVLRVMMFGHETGEEAISVTAGAVTRVDFTLAIEAIVLQEIVVTGTIGATPKAKLPFTVSLLDTDDLPVPQVDAAAAIQGKVPGVTVVSGSGRPGATPSILLRGPVSLDASGRSQDPLIVVDGVILGSSIADLDALDIENVEIVKGAAAASLYGSRAANGVIQISTNRGRGIRRNEVNYTFRSEYGQSELEGSFPLLQTHFFEVTADGQQFVDGAGQPCDFLSCEGFRLAGNASWRGTEAPDEFNTVATVPWPDPGAKDHVETFFENGVFQQHYVAATGRTNATNFHISYSWMKDGAVMPGQDGFERNNFRLNVDQGVRENLIVSASAFYSRSRQDFFPEFQGNPMFRLTRQLAGVDLTACVDDPDTPEDETQLSCYDDPQNMILLTQPFDTESDNPLYEMLTRQYNQRRSRFLGAASMSWQVVPWMDLDANVSYDRLDREETDYYIKGYRTPSPSAVNEGQMDIEDLKNEAFNASVTATGRFTLTDEIRNRTQVRYLFERDDVAWNFTGAREFAVADVPSFSNLNRDEMYGLSSENTSIRADGYFLITNFDMYDRYIIDALVRNDGSSLFGEDEQRQWYYRMAGAWRLGEESWFTLPFQEVKLRAAYGTAGGRPRFEAQYETYTVAAGSVVPATLGNTELKPEFSKETELGIDLLFLNGRMGLTFNYANIVTDDQILLVPLPAYTGFENQWQNAGQITSNSYEFSFDWRVLQTQDFTWSTRFLWDKVSSEITELDVPPFRYGVPGQALGAVFYARKGENVGDFYGNTFAYGCGDLPGDVQGSCDEFLVDENGFFVWVGAGGSLDDADWGANSGLSAGGKPIMWGTPFIGECDDPSQIDEATGLPVRTNFCKVGNSMPDYRWSWGNTFSWRGLTLYALLDAEQGFSVYNQPMQWAIFRRNVDIYDQTGVPEARQKPISYFDMWYGVTGLRPSSEFVEDGSYMKLREVSLRYTLRGDQLADIPALNVFSGITFSLVGRNLITWSDYRGYDPEVGRAGGDTGSAALARVEGYQYPNFRTYTLGIELNF
ncbi:MAG: SusC/RagA family TonB-linked outer membrane protein [Gemmatimonadota bacterium]|nr:MAG: SusC/RagA family TonB-linked outer membrane protein [Gemmatimonadota bacterium]